MYKKIAGVYDIVYSDRTDLKFWNVAAHQYGGPLLEVGCGTGRVLLELAKTGFDITGIDNSVRMLNLLRKKALALKLKPAVKEADMRDFSLDRMFRTILIPFSTFQHMLTERDQDACLQSVRKHLLPDGVVIIDIFNPDLNRPENVMEHHTTVEDAEERTISKFSSQTFNKTLQTINARFFIDVTEKNGTLKRVSVDFKLKYMFQKQLRKLLEKNGFSVIETYGDYSQGKLKEKESPRIIMVARKE